MAQGLFFSFPGSWVAHDLLGWLERRHVVAQVGNIILNVVISVLCSWAVAAYYFRKETGAEKIGDQIRYALQHALFPVLHSEFFSENASGAVLPEQAIPRNNDIPHVEHVRFNLRDIKQGDTVGILLKVRDLGYNLDNPAGIILRDHEDRPLGIVPLGLGFCRSAAHVADECLPGPHCLTVELRDEAGHSNVQTIAFLVAKRST